MRIPGVKWFILSAASLGSLGGCALHSETRDKQGQEALKAWEEVDLNAQVAVPRKNMAALFGQQLKLQDELALAMRDNLARQIATGAKVQDALIRPVGAMLGQLAGSAAMAAQWQTAREDEAGARRAFAVANRQLRWLRLEIPDCATLARPETANLIANWSGTPAQKGILSASVKGMSEACKRPAFNATATVNVGGALGATRGKRNDAAAKLQEQRAAGVIYRNSYRAALAEYEAAAAALTRTPNGSRQKVLDAAGKLKNAADALARLEDAFSVQFLSEQKRDALNAALAPLLDRAEGEDLPANANSATVALAVFPELLDKANQAFADAKKPTLVPLLLQKDLEQIKADAAKRDVDAQLTRMAALDQLLEAQSRQVDRLLQAQDALKGANPEAVAATALGPHGEPTDAKMRLWRATSYYLDAAGRLSAEAGKIEHKLNAIEHERALAYAESNILQWETLIGSNVKQMAQFGASGVKSSHLTSLINSAALLAIAIGTN